jgi:circadian clock protein KaiC
VIGAPGVGKTLLGLSFLIEGAKKGDCGILFGFYEPPPRLIEKAEAVGLPLRKYVDEGLIEIMWMPPLEHYLDALAEQLLETLRTQQLDQRQKRRLFIDGIEGFRSAAAYPDRMGRFLSAFVNQLRMLDITTLFSDGIGLHPPTMEVPNTELVYVVENVIALRNVELRSRLYRLISIMKMQESDYDRSIREFNITNNGIEVADSFESAEHILTGHARVKDDPKERK